MKPEIKSQLIIAAKAYVEARITRFNETIKELEDALKPESRSCMGDKYETSRAMLHLEFEKISGQVDQCRTLKKTVSLIENQPVSTKIGFGSAVLTTGANYFIAIPAGELLVEDLKFYAVGINSPVAVALLGKKVGDWFSVNSQEFEILAIEG